MRAIFKYTLPFMERSSIEMPIGAKVVRCDGIDGFLYIWAIADAEQAYERREFYLFKTGGEIPDIPLVYLGCGAIFVQMELMMYIFEEPRA